MQFNLNDTIKKIFFLICAVFLSNYIFSQNTFSLIYKLSETDSFVVLQTLNLKSDFFKQEDANDYIIKLPSKLVSMGYPFSSVDTFYPNSKNQTVVKLFLGKKITRIQYDYSALSKKDISILNSSDINLKFTSINNFESITELLLKDYENNGYPFASVYLDSINFINDEILAQIKVDKGMFYKIDSIHIEGDAKIKKGFLQRYLNMKEGSAYSKIKLKRIDKKMLELPYIKMLQSSDVSMLGTGATLNLYLSSKKSSQFNFLLGLQPASSINKKFQLTGDINLDLKNSFGYGESILVKWQQLQPKSPRLILGYTKPYILNSAFDAAFGFELFKKDSAFLQLNSQLGLQFSISNTQSGKVFIQWQRTSLLSGGIDTNKIKIEKKLPVNIDLNINHLGFNYSWNNTNYKLNPRNGNDFSFTSLVGLKKIDKNQDIVSIKDAAFNYANLYDSVKLNTYSIRLKINFSHYFPIGQASAFKATINAGTVISTEIFRNELYQIGGFNLLRGFDEESIYAKDYGIISAEYRLLFGINSYLSAFTDFGKVNNNYWSYQQQNQFLSGGIGFLFETKSGVLNLSYAIGKRNDVPFKLREASKIHFGYINYF